MLRIKELFEYQRFVQNQRLQSLIDAVCSQYLIDDAAIAEDFLDLSAAGDPTQALSQLLERSAYDQKRL
ncbi:MAG TPA: hypothetical protein IAB02_03015 [Candidatus Pullichristensenella excrementigallinarum]|uniref:Uncharacterized protein n=1 Tax=Candidatus Pullichristensenella excrementigallinarum TaxID=2840907 RepID=A0A9D1ICU1_9FIRM|nr:hypothetical protein [Candidatus Pullichristensenella excrementigallinarum]